MADAVPSLQSLASAPGAPPAGPGQQGGQPSSPDATNPLAALLSQGQSGPAPAPTQQEAVAGLHHFHEIQKQLGKVLKNKDTGHKSVRAEVLDAGAQLLADKVMSIPDIMNAMKDFPEDPIMQKKWLESTIATAGQAQMKIISDHRAANQGSGDPQAEMAQPGYDPDAHAENMTGLMSHYRKK